jgi:hypothetical protein
MRATRESRGGYVTVAAGELATGVCTSEGRPEDGGQRHEDAAELEPKRRGDAAGRREWDAAGADGAMGAESEANPPGEADARRSDERGGVGCCLNGSKNSRAEDCRGEGNGKREEEKKRKRVAN